MARSSISIVVDQHSASPLIQADANTKLGRELFIKLLNQLRGQLKGNKRASVAEMTIDGAQPVAASVTGICASVVATDTFSINGAALTGVAGTAAANQFDVGASDIICATNLAAAINLSTNAALIVNHVEASNWAGSVTLATMTNGTILKIAGHIFTGRTAPIPTVPPNEGDFSISGTDTQDAAALVVAINSHSVLSHYVVASNSSGVVTIRQRRGTAAIGKITREAIPGVTPSGLTLTTQFVATATVLVSSKISGVWGNAVTSASSGGTITVAAARLAGGTGMNVAPVRFNFHTATQAFS